MFSLLFWLAVSVLSRSALALWPNPRSLTTGSTPLVLSPTFSIEWSTTGPIAPDDVVSAISRAYSMLVTDNMERLVVGRGSADASTIQGATILHALTLNIVGGAPVRSIMTEATAPLGTRDESYTLNVPCDGTAASLSANTTLGLYRGLTTFGQLWYSANGPGSTLYTLEAPISTTDAPAYPYRGFLLDTARNFFPVSTILRQLDAMSYVKLNTFHWHVTDSQSWPLTVRDFPNISTLGAYSPSQTYSLQDVTDIVNYAGERGIDVMMEIDTPGHSGSIFQAYPEYIACYAESPWTTYANEPPAGQLRFALPEVVNFTSAVFHSILSELPSTLFSTGGDELNTNCYENDTPTQEYLTAANITLMQALNTFIVQTHSMVEAMGKTPVVWEEMVLTQNVTLTNDTIVLVWISSEDALAIAERGFRMVQAPSDYFYLDCGAGEWIGDDIANSWCDPFKTWQKAYSYDPLMNLTGSQQSLVLGGQQLLWTEQSGPENVDPIAWPRAAVTAEVFWTGANGPDGNPRNSTEALPRLHDIRYRMVQRGINAINLQPQWCALRPYLCDLYS